MSNIKLLKSSGHESLDNAFINTIKTHAYKGRIHAEFHQLRSDDGGTVTGRFSSSNPNLQQIPARDPEIKKMVRGLFLPEEGTKWGSFDYSSQEPRLLVHFAASIGSSKHESTSSHIPSPSASFAGSLGQISSLSQIPLSLIHI